jgi:hypothetical protein
VDEEAALLQERDEESGFSFRKILLIIPPAVAL